MSQPISIRSHVGADGVLRLEVPTEFADADLEVTVLLSPAESSAPTTIEWQPGFFSDVIGSWEGELTRSDQGEFEIREDWA
ncbi:hypothetical protein [Acaryochloris sp. CCMEE 5410]|uniref:hypothetical protein n=1 Tax=Acaryochloris sp. CCMEE 5410 TaxID=310037 RepID=UPI00024851A7|nr:hypothetical protein [Acaryochloris sp. CCMEE 5410]KAI9130042.1 hypothetical protein ON05_030825 [Acaryochloris sp. CCMEE 5410]